ncbi:MAG: hypothetical protein HN368_08670 [Spirochaetales bacterium]|jgi:hypothetical protein|nr:hypothetical protein [Spirochaetales bacterium]
MKLTSKIIAPIVLVLIIGGILVSMALDLWQTKSSKIPARYSSGRFEGAYNPGDIRGSYSFSDIAASFDVTETDLAKAFGMESASDHGAIMAKDLEAQYGEMDGGEIGTDSIRYFVALATGMPYTPEEGTLLPSPAIAFLGDKVSAEKLEELRNITVSLSGIRQTPANPEEHDESSEAGIMKGKTTFGDLTDWGLSKEEIEQAIGMEMGKSGVTVRDHLTDAGKTFGDGKNQLQSLLDSKK